MMLTKERQEEIFNNIKDEWIKRHGEEKLDPKKLDGIRQVLKMFPHADGCQRCVDTETNRTHLVPFEEIALNGLRGDELHKFPIERPFNFAMDKWEVAWLVEMVSDFCDGRITRYGAEEQKTMKNILKRLEDET